MLSVSILEKSIFCYANEKGKLRFWEAEVIQWRKCNENKMTNRGRTAIAEKKTVDKKSNNRTERGTTWKEERANWQKGKTPKTTDARIMHFKITRNKWSPLKIMRERTNKNKIAKIITMSVKKLNKEICSDWLIYNTGVKKNLVVTN